MPSAFAALQSEFCGGISRGKDVVDTWRGGSGLTAASRWSRHVAAVPAAANQVARVLVIIITREAVHTHNVHGALAAVVGRDPKLAAVS